MDKAKGLVKGGWHPPGDRKITRENWKSDIKGSLTGKKKDPYESARNHESTPLASLKDPESFGPPPKHKEFYGEDGQAINPVAPARVNTSSSLASASSRPSGGLGAPVVETGYAERRRREAGEREAQEQAELSAEKGQPYRADTSGLRTDNLPKPPIRRTTVQSDAASSPGGASVARTASPALPPRAPPRQTTGTIPPPPPPRTALPATSSAPPPHLPPRQNEYPDEHTAPPPPPYNEALSAPSPQQNIASMAQGVASRFGQNRTQPSQDPAAINQGAVSRLSQAGVNVAGFGIGSNANSTTPSAQQVHSAASTFNNAASRFNQSGNGNASSASPQQIQGAASTLQNAASRFNQSGNGNQVNELQQRFARMNPGGGSSTENGDSSSLASAAHQKAPPPPPPEKKAALVGSTFGQQIDDPSGQVPPPVPMSSKPRP